MRNIPFLLVISFFVFLILFSRLPISQQSKQSKAKTIYVKNQPIIVEIADTDDLRTKGLSERTNLASNAGMLFIFPKAGYYHFWMKGMLFPLDFVWINNNEVVDLTENVPIAKNEDASKLPTYTSRVPAKKVLEVNAGAIKSWQITVGDNVRF